MKKTIITLASVAVLIGAANAQQVDVYWGSLTGSGSSYTADLGPDGTVGINYTIGADVLNPNFSFTPAQDFVLDAYNSLSSIDTLSTNDADGLKTRHTITLDFSNYTGDAGDFIFYGDSFYDNTFGDGGSELTFVGQTPTLFDERFAGSANITTVSGNGFIDANDVVANRNDGGWLLDGIDTSSPLTIYLDHGSQESLFWGVGTKVVPEPSSTALLGLGALGLLARRKR